MSFLLSRLFPSLTWRINTKEKILYLTFDDGPIPEATPWVLDILNEYGAKATFFCVGENARKNPHILERIIAEKHSVGNHTMNHLNGWNVNTGDYISNIDSCSKYVSSNLFRPPYGRIRLSQIQSVKKKYKIIMWNVLSKDYDITLTGQQCFEIVKRKSKAGSIVVFHDSIKAKNRLQEALPATLNYFSNLGYRFDALT